MGVLVMTRLSAATQSHGSSSWTWADTPGYSLKGKSRLGEFSHEGLPLRQRIAQLPQADSCAAATEGDVKRVGSVAFALAGTADWSSARCLSFTHLRGSRGVSAADVRRLRARTGSCPPSPVRAPAASGAGGLTSEYSIHGVGPTGSAGGADLERARQLMANYAGKGPGESKNHDRPRSGPRNPGRHAYEGRARPPERRVQRPRARDAQRATMRCVAEAIALIEQPTGRTVVGFISDNHLDPDLGAEVFVLAARRQQRATPRGRLNRQRDREVARTRAATADQAAAPT
jgi:hypothetical protein